MRHDGCRRTKRSSAACEIFLIASAAGVYDVQGIRPKPPNGENNDRNDIRMNNSIIDDNAACATAMALQLVHSSTNAEA